MAARASRSSVPAQAPASPAPADLLRRAVERTAEEFAAEQRILTYEEYLARVLQAPQVHLRDAATYLRDVFDHYGREEQPRPWGEVTRFRLFDAPFDGGRERLVGQEQAQMAFYRILTGFVRDGRPNRLVLLHGPNGSAKSTFVLCIMRALEHYSGLDAGAVYRFNWIFPTEKLTRGGLGFRDAGRLTEAGGSFARLEDADIDARIACEVRDHPLLVLPAARRAEVIAAALGGRGDVAAPELLVRSGLCHKCKQIFDALMIAYHGDLAKVLRHVQVERFTFSRGYRRGAIVIGPQMSVDGGERQITADRSLAALPSALQNMALFEPYGELIDGAGGLISFDDLLKRPLDSFKYLLTTIETGEVTLPHSILRLNAVLVATSNEMHLEAFRKHPEYSSFRGRLTLVQVPYLREHPREREIYEMQIVPHMDRHVTPHALDVAARWAVMTRLSRPDKSHFDPAVRSVISTLRVEEKAALYAGEGAPEGLDPDQVKALLAIVPQIRDAGGGGAGYEGSSGASPREVRGVLLLAAQRPAAACLSPQAVLAEIEALCSRRSDYAFLQEDAEEGGYHETDAIIEWLRGWVLDRIEEDVRESSELVEAARFTEMLDRYVTELRHWVKKEAVVDKATGAERFADEELMERVERYAGIRGDAQGFRNEMMTRIGAFRTENPGKKIELPVLFADLLRKIRAAILEERRPQVFKLAERLLVGLSDADAVPAEDRPRVAAMLSNLEKRGYCRACVREALGDWMRRRPLKGSK